jgi:predicted nucleic acid-binding protein
MPSESGERRIVSDTGPLISLEKLPGAYRFIRLLYDRILIPPAVLEELAHGQFEQVEDYIAHFGIADLLEVRTPPSSVALPETKRLDRGERQAIQLAQVEKLPLLIEEEAGRQVARSLDIPISGIAGQVLKAVRHDVLSAEDGAGRLQSLLAAGRINTRVYEAVLQAVQEEA